MKINGNLTLNSDGSGVIQNAYVESGAANPATVAQAGRLFYNTTNGSFSFSTGVNTWSAPVVTTTTTDAITTDVSNLQTEVDNIEAASGGIFNTAGTYDGAILDALTNVTGSTDLADALTQLDTAITNAAGVDTLGELTNVTDTSNAAGFVMYSTGTATWATALPGVTSGVQAYDAGLDSIAGLTTAADTMIYTTALDTYATTSLTAFARTLLDDADQATMQATLGLVPGTDVQAYDAGLDALAAKTSTGIMVQTGADTFTSVTLAASTVAGDEGISLVNADGTAGNPTIGLDIVGLTAEGGTPSSTDVFAMYDGVNNVKVSLTQLTAAIVGEGIALDDLSDVSNTLTPAGVGSGNSIVLKSDGTNFAAETLELADVNNVSTTNGVVTADTVNVLVGDGTGYDVQNMVAGADLTFDMTGVLATLNVDDSFLRNTGDTLDSGTLTIASGAAINAATGSTISMVDAPSSANHLTNKAYVDALVAAGASWKNPVVDSDLTDIITANPATPEATYSIPVGGDVSFIVDGGGAGVTLSYGTGTTVNVPASTYQVVNLSITSAGNGDYSLIETPLAVGDRFILGAEHAGTIGSGLTGLTVDGFALAKGDLIEYIGTGLTGADWSTPDGRVGTIGGATEFDQGITVLNSDPDSTHYGHTFLYNAQDNVWVEISGPGSIGAGTGLSYTGNTLNIGLGAGIVELPSDEVGIDLYATSNPLLLTSDGSTPSTATGAQLHLRYDNSTIGVNGSTQLYIPNEGVTATQLAAAVAGLGLAGGNGTALSFDPSELTDTATVSGDYLVLSDADASGAPIKRSVSSFIADHSLQQSVTASDGLVKSGDDLQLDIGTLVDTAVVGTDTIVFNDGDTAGAGGTHAKRSFANVMADLDIVNGITANGFTVRTAEDTYTSRSIAVSGAGAEAGLAVTNGDGVSGNPTLGLDITGTAALGAAPDTADELILYDTSGTANVKITVAELADAVAGATTLNELSDVVVTDYIVGDVLVADGTDSYDQTTVQYTFEATGVAQTSYTITHALGQYVSVTVLDASTNDVIIPNSITMNATGGGETVITLSSALLIKAVIIGFGPAVSQTNYV